MEEWRTIENYPGYEVSSLGRLKNTRGLITDASTSKQTEYMRICLINKKGKFRTTMHRLVCFVFNGPPPFPDAKALHKNDIFWDNRSDNLYWGTGKQNMQDRIINGSMPYGEDCHNTSLTWEQVRLIRKLYAEGNITQKALGLQFKCHKATIGSIIRKKNWKE